MKTIPTEVHGHAPKGPSRRDLLKGLGCVGLSAAGLSAASQHDLLAQAPGPPSATPLPAPVQATVSVFDLSEVDLLDGPFLRARQRSQKYLLSLDPDRLLHTFRVNAGLQPRAEVYGGWESAPLWADIHCQGHTLGHYLSGCALMYGSTADESFKQRADYIVAELRDCQAAGKTGLITAFPEGNTLLDSVLSGGKYTGVPWYTLHKVYAGLRDASLYTKNPVALEVLVRFSDWAVTATSSLSEVQFQKMLDVEHGGMNEVLTDVYGMTGDARYLALARRFCHKAVLDPLARSRDNLDGLHANTQIPKIIGFSRLYQATGEQQYLTASAFFWRTVADTRSFVNGNHGDGEHFFPVANFDQHVFSAKASETCCDYNMLKLTRTLFQIAPSAHYADFHERALYNDILASQDPDTGMVTYFQGNRPGYMKLYCTPVDSFWCCTGSGMENHAKYNDSIYFKSDESIYVNLFVPSVVKVQKGTKLIQTNQFPETASTKLQWKTEQPVQKVLKVRHPGWCQTATVTINGKQFVQSKRAGSFIELKRLWHDGDTVEVDLPMELRAIPLPGNPNIVAFVYGPIVLAGDLGNEGIAQGADLNVNERLYGEVLSTAIPLPVLTGDAPSLLRLAKPADTAMTFTLPASGAATQVKLIPYYKIAHRRYITYWELAPEPDRLSVV